MVLFRKLPGKPPASLHWRDVQRIILKLGANYVVPSLSGLFPSEFFEVNQQEHSGSQGESKKIPSLNNEVVLNMSFKKLTIMYVVKHCMYFTSRKHHVFQIYNYF